MTSIRSYIHAFCLVFAAAVLAGCAATQRPDPTSQPSRSPTEQARQAELEDEHARAAELYIEAAGEADNPAERQRLRLSAGLDAAQAGQATRARQILDGIQASSLDDDARVRYELASTLARIAAMPATRALTELPPPSGGTDPDIAQRVWLKRSELHFAQNDLIAGMHALVQRGIWLVDDTALATNDARIYDKALQAIAYGQGPDSRAARNADTTTRGWLALAAIGQRRWADRAARDRALTEWENEYQGHPAARSVLSERFDYDSTMAVSQPSEPGAGAGRADLGPAPEPPSDTVALALPLSGDFARAGEAIRDGFLFAYETDSSAPGQPLIYDTNTMSADAIQRRARQDNVGILVGPLNKSKVAAMASQAGERPIVALNRIDRTITEPGFYQFALAPEDDARTVARHAADEGHERALALVPKGDWGSRVFDAFRERFSAGGGRVIDYATYDSDQHDHRGPIQSVLSGYPGNEADFIFVAAAQPVQARLIRSQLRFYRATGLPMLSTSHIYSGTPDPGEDIDLNGVSFADLPWVIGDGAFLDDRRKAAAERYGDTAERYTRLFAMGMDAWRLTAQIGSGGLRAGDTFEGMTGILAVRPDNRIERFLAWAVFRGGRPQLVEMPSRADVRDETSEPAPWEP